MTQPTHIGPQLGARLTYDEEAALIQRLRESPSLNDEQHKLAQQWAADDRLWTTQQTVEINLGTFARFILKAAQQPACPATEATETGWNAVIKQIERMLDAWPSGGFKSMMARREFDAYQRGLRVALNTVKCRQPAAVPEPAPPSVRITSDRIVHTFRALHNAHASFDLDALEVLHVALRELSSPESMPTGYAEGWNAAVKAFNRPTIARTPLEDVSDAEIETAVNSDDPIESLDRLTRPQMMNRPCKCGHDEWHHCVNEGRIKPDLSCRACECVQFNPK